MGRRPVSRRLLADCPRDSEPPGWTEPPEDDEDEQGGEIETEDERLDRIADKYDPDDYAP